MSTPGVRHGLVSTPLAMNNYSATALSLSVLARSRVGTSDPVAIVKHLASNGVFDR